MSDLNRIREDNARAREKCAKCGEERQSHAYVRGVYGNFWICQSAVFVASVSPPPSSTDE